MIIVTSNYDIKDIFPDPAIHKPLLRRFKVIHKTVAWNATVNDLMPKTVNGDPPQPTGAGLWEAKAKKTFKLKKRKFDEPKKAKKPWTSKKGKIVPNTTNQMVIEDTILPLNKTQEITPIEISDEGDEIELLFTEKCSICGELIHICVCFDEDEDERPEDSTHWNIDDSDDPDYDASSIFGDESSEDLRDL